MEDLHIRLKEEIDRLGLSMAEAARRMGENDSQELRDVCSGRKRASAALMAKIATADIGADVLYILTGQRGVAPAPALKPDEEILLDNYRHCDQEGKLLLEKSSIRYAQPRKKKA